MSAKRKVQKGPSWFEVGLGAFLSVILGVLVGAAYLVERPVAKVTTIPKDAPTDAVFYIEGSKDSSGVVEQKRKEFVSGQTITVSEGELNGFIESYSKVSAPPPPPPAAAKPGDKAPPPAPAADLKVLDVGVLNARISGGKLQLGTSVTVNLFGFNNSVFVQATGTVSRSGSGFVFDPERFYVGGCPMTRLLFLRDYAMKKLLYAQPPPDDVVAAWSKLSDVSISGTSMTLKMP
jgi:hypothetical protein